MTIRRADLKRGFEPDNCYYVQHELQMREEKKIDFRTDPPPDLAVEVEVARKLLNEEGNLREIPRPGIVVLERGGAQGPRTFR